MGTGNSKLAMLSSEAKGTGALGCGFWWTNKAVWWENHQVGSPCQSAPLLSAKGHCLLVILAQDPYSFTSPSPTWCMFLHRSVPILGQILWFDFSAPHFLVYGWNPSWLSLKSPSISISWFCYSKMFSAAGQLPTQHLISHSCSNSTWVLTIHRCAGGCVCVCVCKCVWK